jgi:hypothetical protein
MSVARCGPLLLKWVGFGRGTQTQDIARIPRILAWLKYRYLASEPLLRRPDQKGPLRQNGMAFLQLQAIE